MLLYIHVKKKLVYIAAANNTAVDSCLIHHGS